MVVAVGGRRITRALYRRRLDTLWAQAGFRPSLTLWVRVVSPRTTFEKVNPSRGRREYI
jgi:hypothetical protein